MADVQRLLDLFDRVVAACDGVVPRQMLEEAAAVGRSCRRRVGYLGETVVVALAGGTGTGKSSLLNALAGEEVSEPGARRPTTADPVAWVPTNPEPGLSRLLDDLGIERRVGHDGLPWLAVIDLPDTDSVVADHRVEVERLLPLVDAVVWVTDPEKYQDARLHREFVAPLAGYGDRFVFLLNQVDRLDSGTRELVVDDFRRSIEADGVPVPTVLATAGDPPLGAPVGLESLIEALAGLGDAKSVVVRHVVDELTAAADRLVAPLGGAGGTGFSARWILARDAVADTIADLVDTDLRRRARRTATADTAVVTGLLGGRTVADRVEAGTGGAPPVSTGDPIRVLVEEVGTAVDPETRLVLADVADRVEQEVGAAALTVASGTSVSLLDPPPWWSAVRVLSYGAVAALVIGIGLMVDALRSGERLVPAVSVSVAAVATLALVRAMVAKTARERVEASLRERGRLVAAAVSSELERRLGRPVREALRARSAPGAAHIEFTLAVKREIENR